MCDDGTTPYLPKRLRQPYFNARTPGRHEHTLLFGTCEDRTRVRARVFVGTRHSPALCHLCVCSSYPPPWLFVCSNPCPSERAIEKKKTLRKWVGGVPLWRAWWPRFGVPHLVMSGRSRCSGRLSRRRGAVPHPRGLRPRLYWVAAWGTRRPAENEALCACRWPPLRVGR